METRANYLLIGAFTIGGFLGLLAFVLWFARLELDRQFDYYDVLFASVSGLSSASEVRFAGLPVGQVVEVELDPQRSGLVRARIEVQDGTPVRVSSFATIETLGVTGVSFVGITAGNPGDPLLAEVSEDPVPDIPSRRSPLQSLAEDAPEILEEILQVSRSVSDLLGEATQQRVVAILENVEASSGSLDRALQDFSQVTDTIATASEDIASFTGRLEAISGQAESTLRTADATMQEVTELALRAEGTLGAGDAALASARRTFDGAGDFVEQELPALAARAEETLAALRAEVERVGAATDATLGELRQAGTEATERLRDTE
ncbi:MAG TPA: MlaD family protein, partial [Myxococcota bacterium]|nr:MlaD family protein [Myxococcota bacterium]